MGNTSGVLISGVNHDLEMDNSDFSWDEMSTMETETDGSMNESDDEFEEMAHLERAVQHELQLLHAPTHMTKL
jgi:hypothetical protein